MPANILQAHTPSLLTLAEVQTPVGFKLWMLVAAWLVTINVATFFVFGADKHSARSGARRTPERTLLILALIGGSPAAYAAQQFFRHKTAKTSFQAAFWLIVAAQVAGLSWWFLRGA